LNILQWEQETVEWKLSEVLLCSRNSVKFSTPKASYLSMSIYSLRSLSIYVYLLPKLPISPCLSTPRNPSLSMSIYSQSFLSLHVYLLPEIPLYLCLFTPGASYLSMSIYSRRSLSFYVYSLPELPISPCLSTPGDPSLSMSIYSWSPFVLHLYLFPELLLSPYLSTLRSVLLCYLPLLMCPALSTRCYWENMPWCCWQLGNLTTSYNIYWCIMFYYFPRPG